MCRCQTSIGERSRRGIVAIGLGTIKNGDRFPIGGADRRLDSFVRTGIEVAVAFGVLCPVELGENSGRRYKRAKGQKGWRRTLRKNQE